MVNKAQEKKVKKDIPFIVADRYFLKNSVADTSPTWKSQLMRILTAFFGMATVMGESGQPRRIDFSKQYVLALIKPETDRELSISAVKLEKDAEGTIVFTYKVTLGDERSFTVRPCLVVVVDNGNDDKVTFNEIS